MITTACINEQIARLQKIWGKQVFDAEDDRGIDRRRALAEVLATAETEYAAQSAVSALIHEHGRVYCPTPGELVTALESAPEVAPESEPKPDPECELCQGTGQRPRYYREHVHRDGCGPVSSWYPVTDEEHQTIREGRASNAGLVSAVERCPCWQPAEAG
jgi:hypothetical protein